MPTLLAEDRRMLLDAIREFARNELLEADRRWDEGDSTVWEMLPAIAEMGLLGLSQPESAGGLDCDMSTYAAVIQELAYASPSAAVTISVHSMTSKILSDHASQSWRDEYLESLSSHESLLAFAISEADAGSDPAATTTRGVKVDGGYRVSGSKMWITNGLRARWFMVLVRTDENETRKRGLSALLIDGTADGIERDVIHGKMGIRGSETVVLHLNDVFVPDNCLLGDEGGGLSVFLSALDEGRIGIAAQAAGISEACLDAMVAYAPQRVQFGKPIAKFQAIQNMVADSATELEASKLLIDRAARKFDSGQRDPKASAMAKLYASEAANRIAYRAVQVHGGSGYVKECRVEQLFRDARITTIYEGTSEIQRYVIAKDLLRNGIGD